MEPLDTMRRQAATLRETRHRPFPVPREPWVIAQTWEHLLFAHWSVDPDSLAPLVPPPLAVDVRDGRAWIAVTPFVLSGLRVRLTPPPPVLSHFLETNVRTYVRLDGRPGILFFSLEATSVLAVTAARALYHLPYRHAEGSVSVDGEHVHYVLRRSDGTAMLEATYRPVSAAAPPAVGSLEQFLAERYCLYSTADDRLFRADIHHPPWPLAAAEGAIQCQGMVPPAVVQHPGGPLLHVARRQDVLTWRPVRVVTAPTASPQTG
jgi:uncharacterized protein YqjF (DUF2071 family)